jgi:GTP-binding protein
LLNTLVGVRGMARISGSPGRTQAINFFLVDDKAYFVDLPGYGYARVPKKIREGWQPMVESYIRNRPQLRLVLLLVDCRIPPTENDVLMKEWLDHNGIEHAVILTKADKLSRSQLNRTAQAARQRLGTKDLIPFSSVTGLGKDAVLTRIQNTIAQASEARFDRPPNATTDNPT